MSLTREQVIEIVSQELPHLLTERPELRYTLVGVAAETLARRDELRDVLAEIKTLREDWTQDSQRVWRELRGLREDFNARFAEHARRLDEFSQRMENLAVQQTEHSRRLDEFSQRMDEHSQAIKTLIGEMQKFDSRLVGLGARWGILSEQAFRAGMSGVLLDFGYTVERFLQKDVEGFVWGRPEQVEIDVVLRDGQTILGETKAALSWEDVLVFQRKTEYYERVKNVRVSRRFIVSPFAEPQALERAKEFDIQVYTSEFSLREAIKNKEGWE